MKLLPIILLLIPIISYSQELETFNNHCVEGGFNSEGFIERISNHHWANGNLIIEIETLQDCSFVNSKGIVERMGESLTIYFQKLNKKINDSTEIEEVTFCTCLFRLTYEISGIEKYPVDIIFNDRPIKYQEYRYETFPIRFEVTEHGDTINYTDKFGLRQGHWREEIQATRDSVLYLRKSRFYYEDDDVIHGITSIYDRQNRLRAKVYFNHHVVDIYEFDDKGNIIEVKIEK